MPDQPGSSSASSVGCGSCGVAVLCAIRDFCSGKTNGFSWSYRDAPRLRDPWSFDLINECGYLDNPQFGTILIQHLTNQTRKESETKREEKIGSSFRCVTGTDYRISPFFYCLPSTLVNVLRFGISEY